VRVPTPNVSLIDVVFEVEKKTTIEEVNNAIKAAANGKMKGVLSYTEEPLVSIDFRMNPHSSIVDLELTNVLDGQMVKIFSWYDNEWGFSKRVIDLIHLIGRSL
jgi:glyceraldehyde 3-phosphate dehydrogenase